MCCEIKESSAQREDFFEIVSCTRVLNNANFNISRISRTFVLFSSLLQNVILSYC